MTLHNETLVHRYEAMVRGLVSSSSATACCAPRR